MAAPKRTTAQRESDLRIISELYLKGWYQADIGKKLGLSQKQISYDLSDIQKRWQTSTLLNSDSGVRASAERRGKRGCR